MSFQSVLIFGKSAFYLVPCSAFLLCCSLFGFVQCAIRFVSHCSGLGRLVGLVWFPWVPFVVLPFSTICSLFLDLFLIQVALSSLSPVLLLELPSPRGAWHAHNFRTVRTPRRRRGSSWPRARRRRPPARRRGRPTKPRRAARRLERGLASFLKKKS